MRRTLLLALVVGIPLGTPCVGLAQLQESSGTGPKTLLTVSLSGFDAIRKDLQFIAKASGNPQLMLFAILLAGEEPVGLDTAKPWGAVVQTDGQEFPICAFVPATDVTQFLKVAEKQGGAPVPEPDEHGVYPIDVPGRQIFLQQRGDWTFIADSRENLANTPADPAGLLGGLNESYALAFRLTFKNAPPSIRDQVLDQVRKQVADRQHRRPGESDWQYAVRKLITPRSMEDFTKWLNEADAAQVGLAVDHKSRALHLEAEITAIEGTSAAEGYALLSESKSTLAGFLMPEAALSALVAGTTSQWYADQIKETIDSYASEAIQDIDRQDLSETDRQLAKQVLEELVDVIRETVETRRVDVGVAMLAGEQSLNLVGASFVADTAKLERLFKQVVSLAVQEDPGVAEAVTFDAEEYQGVRLHTVSVPVANSPNGDLPAILGGDHLTAVVGFSSENAYLAIGPNAKEKLKQAIDQSKAAADQPVAPFRLSLSATAIGHVIEGVDTGDEPGPPPELIAALKQAGENDHVAVIAEGIANGLRIRLEVEEGFIKVIGAAATEAQSRVDAGR